MGELSPLHVSHAVAWPGKRRPPLPLTSCHLWQMREPALQLQNSGKQACSYLGSTLTILSEEEIWVSWPWGCESRLADNTPLSAMWFWGRGKDVPHLPLSPVVGEWGSWPSSLQVAALRKVDPASLLGSTVELTLLTRVLVNLESVWGGDLALPLICHHLCHMVVWVGHIFPTSHPCVHACGHNFPN